jgi:peptidoglycan hydrolase CwlO-like protein
MELTQEYFDRQLEQLNKRFDGIVTKDDLNTALKAQTKELEDYTDSVAATILVAVDNGFEKINQKLDSRDKKLEKVETDLQRLKGALHLSP